MAAAVPNDPACLSGDELTIDELARAAATTVRNVRAYQARGLLPPPTIRARTGYYGPQHLTRLAMIQTLQAEGFRLKAIKRLLERPGGAAEHILDFGRTLLSSFDAPASEFATTTELSQRLGGRVDPRLVRKAEKLGLIRRLSEDRWEILNPTLLSAGAELLQLGIPLSHALAVAEQIDRHTRAIAKSYVRLFVSDVVGEERSPDGNGADWGRLSDALERLRPLAYEAIRTSFERAMSEMVEQHLPRIIRRP